MTGLKGLRLNALSARPKLPAPRVIPNNTAEFARVVKEETHRADADLAVTDAIIAGLPGGASLAEMTEENIADSNDKLARLVDDDFPFDESQLAAVYGMIRERFACMIGAAGTGKTTLEKKLVDLLADSLDLIDVSQYWMRGAPEEEDDYEIPEKLIASILMCSFTGRSTQMTKKNFPVEWHGNIMTIHRALGFYPEFFMDADAESGELVNKRRFVPAYTADNLMPWDIIIIDEAGMLGLDLWHQLYAAMKPGCRVYMVGDINQLPPTHGKSILGFALAKWPTWELTHVHRQQGANNSIVDNAHRVLKGLRPVSDSPKPLTIKPLDSAPTSQAKMQPMLDTLKFMTQDDSWRFLTVDIDEEHKVAAIRIRQMLKLLHGKIYEPNRDFVITPINGFEQTSPGYALGQQPLNQQLVIALNQDAPRYIIDAGRERQNFAVGDKVMATINDYEAGITNGMTGIVESIADHGGYMGDTRRFGLISEVNEYYEGLTDDDDDDVEFSLEDMVSDSQAGIEALKQKEKKESGPASHIITVRFGEGVSSFTVPFASKSQVASLQLAYAATCHKLQGGEAPLVFVICHGQHKRPLNREWLYTAVTRGSHRVVLLQTRQGVGHAVSKQSIKGVNLKAKIASFAALTQEGLVGATVRVKLPRPQSLVTDLSTEGVEYEEAKLESAPAPEQPRQQATRERIILRETVFVVREVPSNDDSQVAETIDGGELRAATNHGRAAEGQTGQTGQPLIAGNRQPALPAPTGPRLVSTMGAVEMAITLGRAQLMANRLLTHNKDTNNGRPVPVLGESHGDSHAKPATPPANRLSALLAKANRPQAQPTVEQAEVKTHAEKPKSALAMLLAKQKK